MIERADVMSARFVVCDGSSEAVKIGLPKTYKKRAVIFQ